ncbi:hypothetical protein M5689_015267 [Euphorbia peplus]|nr:hypothetical protein M5689_015267 [Euphorbia peplus]
METSKEASYPWLLIQDAKDNRKLVYYDLSKREYHKKTIHQMENRKICSCFYGWFILKDVALEDYFLFNPINLETIKLPPLPNKAALDSYLFLSPTHSNCHVIFFDENNNNIFFCKPRDEKFIQRELEGFKGFTMIGEKGYGCLLDNGRRYFAAITFEASQIQIEHLPIDDVRMDTHSYYGDIGFKEFLVEACGELLLVCPLYLCGWELYDIVVFKVDPKEEKWVEIENIESSTIFISKSRSAIACKVHDSSIQKNSVYIFNQNERFFHVFDIEDNSFSMTLPCPAAAQSSLFQWMITDGSHPI